MLHDLSLGFMDFINKKDLKPSILQNAELLTHFASVIIRTLQKNVSLKFVPL